MFPARGAAVLLTLTAAVLVSSCGDSTVGTTASQVVVRLQVSPDSATVLKGARVPLTATLTDAAGDTLSGPAVNWSSSDAAIATVNSSGVVTVVTGIAVGSAAIVAVSEGQADTADVTVMVITLASLTVGSAYTCGVTTSGSVYCWGWNSFGQLGDGSTTRKITPVPVSDGLAFSSVSAGLLHTCGVTTGGAAYCWGWNEFGQLGTETSESCVFNTVPHRCSTRPIAVSGGLTFASVSAGVRHTCGVTTTGAAYCWGSGEAGRLGNGSTLSSSTPVPISGALTFASVSVGGETSHSCGLTADGDAYCWGGNPHGELGNGTRTSSTVPVPVSGGLRFGSLSAGGRQTCGVTTDGIAYCWGWNIFGALGTGETADSDTPAPVAGGLTFASLSAGSVHGCGVTTDGAAYCWGWNEDGSLGDGSTINRTAPVAVSGGLTFASVSLGAVAGHTCGITTTGAYCWGSNGDGQLGDGTSATRKVPTRILGQP